MSNVLGALFGDIADAIREKTGDTATMKPAEFPAKISGIKVGGGSVEGVHFVTFMSEDGTVELYKRPVADGDDCADPVMRNLISAPTKASTAQYNYDHAGWATEPNGALNANALKAVTEDRTVYANFAAILRYYTISFYDGDALLESKSVAYGTVPSVTKPAKDGYTFDSWEPELVAVTGDATYTAKWVEKITFADGTWADITRIAESGKARDYFTVGDTKTVTISGVVSGKFVIIDINHDDLADGSGKAGLTIASTFAVNKYDLTGVSLSTLKDGWVNTALRSAMNTTGYAKFPSDLRPHMKDVKKLTVGGTETGTDLEESVDKVFFLSATEFFGDGVSYTPSGQGTQYEYYKTSENRKVKRSGTVISHSTRSRSSYYTGRAITVDVYGSAYAQSSLGNDVIIAFCV